MPRRDFQCHLKEAQEGTLPDHVLSLNPGDDDGTFTLLFKIPNSTQIKIQAQASDVGDYPREHSFFIYSDTNDIPQAVSTAIQSTSIITGLTVGQAVREIAGKLTNASTKNAKSQDEDTENLSFEDEEADFSDGQEEDGFSGDEDDDDPFDSFGINPPAQSTQTNQQTSLPHRGLWPEEHQAFKARILRDFQYVKQAGFRVSHYGDIRRAGQQCYLMISIRVAKLGIPEHALKAWLLDSEEYIMLILQYHRGYRALEAFKDSHSAASDLTMHLVVTKGHKISLAEIGSAINSTKHIEEDYASTEKSNNRDRATRPLFIGSAIDELLNTRLITLIRYRSAFGYTWKGAMSYYNDMQGQFNDDAIVELKYAMEKDVSKLQSLPALILSDHLQEETHRSQNSYSLPCAAMQFALRHIVRCTEFCLVCFDNTNHEHEALKPYVCSKPLCLYQYMSMGLGPGIEFEILSQPHVVDLLISFCYVSASYFALKSLPMGLGLMVPNPVLIPGFPHSDFVPRPNSVGTPGMPDPAAQNATTPSEASVVGTLERNVVVEARWRRRLDEFVLPNNYNIESDASRPVKRFMPGDWCAFWTIDHKLYHCKIVEVYHPVYRIQYLIQSKAMAHPDRPQNDLAPSEVTRCRKHVTEEQNNKADELSISIIPYNKLFDEFGRCRSQNALRIMLDTLPSVTEMADYLRGARGRKGELAKWTEQMCPSALSILRWIIASNRSCIVCTTDNEGKEIEERVQGMPGYIQFRFASGAPDKESRFLKAVDTTKARLRPYFPTLFAWHGSHMKNWHSIIREGLNFDTVENGRAYGNGVYHALQASTSVGYAREEVGHQWPSTILRITHALSLNEIVNAPSEFLSSSPFLVIDKVDWIQTRYLFVKCSPRTSELDPRTGFPLIPLSSPKEYSSMIMRSSKSILFQDSEYTPVDTNKNPLVIPICAISMSRLETARKTMFGRLTLGDVRRVADVQYTSEDSDREDQALYDPWVSHYSKEGEGTSSSRPEMDYVPGKLDRKTLPTLAPPTYATSASTIALQREIKSMIKEQDETPPHELGWYLDPEYLDNPYQWIIELHSFDQGLPLAKDMKERELISIVLEVRFGPNFNFSPPFVRVVRPRFLPFLQGGGGHVTAGGALCMQLLTSDGWNPSSTMSAVLLQIRLAMSSLDPKPARLEQGRFIRDYGVDEAVDAYLRACQTHGWKVPEDFRATTSTSDPPASTEPATAGGGLINSASSSFKRQRRT